MGKHISGDNSEAFLNDWSGIAISAKMPDYIGCCDCRNCNFSDSNRCSLVPLHPRLPGGDP